MPVSASLQLFLCCSTCKFNTSVDLPLSAVRPGVSFSVFLTLVPAVGPRHHSKSSQRRKISSTFIESPLTTTSSFYSDTCAQLREPRISSLSFNVNDAIHESSAGSRALLSNRSKRGVSSLFVLFFWLHKITLSKGT